MGIYGIFRGIVGMMGLGFFKLSGRVRLSQVQGKVDELDRMFRKEAS